MSIAINPTGIHMPVVAGTNVETIQFREITCTATQFRATLSHYTFPAFGCIYDIKINPGSEGHALVCTKIQFGSVADSNTVISVYFQQGDLAPFLEADENGDALA